MLFCLFRDIIILVIKMKDNILNIIDSFKKPCPCGKVHETAIKDIRIGSGLVNKAGEILCDNNFPKDILLVADKNTLAAAEGIIESLKGFDIHYKIYDNIRVADTEDVKEIEGLIENKNIAVLSVGTGSVNDPCRLACANKNKPLCIFATAPSMDGFASYSSPLVCNGFKSTYPAKSPEVIIGDTKILANAPNELKSAGFGDMVSKYIALIDWQVSTLITGEYYCERIASLTRDAIDELFEMADKVTVNDEYTAGKIFEALLKTGIGMSFSQNSRPASGSEHIISHLIECVELRDGIIPNYHGDDIGVCTLEVLKLYNSLLSLEMVSPVYENPDWEDIFEFYGDMAEEVRKLNFPENIIDEASPEKIRECWNEIKNIIKSVPDYESVKAAMKKAGCKITVSDIGKSNELFYSCLKYSPYMRKRMTLLRMRDMIGF